MSADRIEALKLTANRLRNSIAWLRDGVSVPNGISVPDMELLLTLAEEALATQPAQPATSQPVGASGVVERDQFETWAAARDTPLKLDRAPFPHEDEYNWSSTIYAWGIWQELRAALSAPQPAAQPQAVEDADKVDAERYRWLRDAAWFAEPPPLSEDMVWCVAGPNGNNCWPVDGGELDKAVDAARTAAAGGKERQRASDIIRAEPWLKSAEVRERLGGDK